MPHWAIDCVSKATGIPVECLLARGKQRRLVAARRCAVFMMRHQGMSWPAIGAVFDQPHHWALKAEREARRRIEDKDLEYHAILRAAVDELGKLIG